MKPREVMVRIEGIRRPCGEEAGRAEEDTSVCLAPGVYSYRNGTHFLIYEENDGGRCLTRNTVKVRENAMEVVKQGELCARMVFRAGQRSSCLYETPYGTIDMAFLTEHVRIGAEVSGPEEPGQPLWRAEASYMLELEGRAAARCSVRVSVYDREEGQEKS